MSNSAPEILRVPLAQELEWPCRVRVSQRARKIKLSMNSHGRLELIIPQKQVFSATDKEKFVQEMRPWIQKNIDKLLDSASQKAKAKELWQEYTQQVTTDIVPQYIDLPAIYERWKVSIQSPVDDYVRLEEINAPLYEPNTTQVRLGELSIFSSAKEGMLCAQLLQKWLIHRARPRLTAKTLELAKDMGVSVTKVTIKAQRGRWGSCTVAGNISLNCRLLLLKPELMEHVILHELCHRVHMNHSPAFKELLESVSAHSVEKDAEIFETWKKLPTWAILKK